MRHTLQSSLLLLILLSVLPATSVRGPSTFNYTVRQNDVFVLLINPPVNGLAAVCQPLVSMKPFKVYVAVNESQNSVVQVLLEASGYYNVTVSFQSQTPWGFSMGVFTRNPDWYVNYANITMVQGVSLVEFMSVTGWDPGSYELSILIDVRAIEEAGGFPFYLPKQFNGLVFAVATALLAYPNSFLFVDTYFKNKREGVSKKRLFGISLILLISIYIIYQVYLFATFTVS